MPGFLASVVSRDGGAVYWSSGRQDLGARLGRPRPSAATSTPCGASPRPSWATSAGASSTRHRSSTGRATAAHGRAPAFGAPGRDTDTTLCWVAPSPTGGLTATGQLWKGRRPERLVTWSSQDGSMWFSHEGATDTDGGSIRTCNRLQEPQWSATTDVGTVRVEPFGDVGFYTSGRSTERPTPIVATRPRSPGTKEPGSACDGRKGVSHAYHQDWGRTGLRSQPVLLVALCGGESSPPPGMPTRVLQVMP